MGEAGFELLHGWPRGVNTSLMPQIIPEGTSPRAWNNDLVHEGLPGEDAVVRRRLGALTVNTTAISGATAVTSMFEYNIVTGSGNTRYHLVVSSNGRLDKVISATATAVADAGNATPFTGASGQNFVDFSEAANLCFFANGLDLKKFNGTAVQNFGITRPSVVATIADSGVSGLHNGTYEARYTYYNSVTGVESSASDTSGQVTVTNKKLNWTWTVPGDTQVDNVRLYLRNVNTQSVFYQVVQTAIGTSQPFLTNTLDANNVITAPTTSQNNPPLSTIKHLAWHHSRMFAADDNNLYYSQIGVPEQFDPNAFERVNPGDGQRIVALVSTQQQLIVFKRNSFHALIGDDPTAWTLAIIDPTIGCVSARSLVRVEGSLYWWSDQGPMMWPGYGPPQPIGLQLISTTVDPDNVDQASLVNIAGVVDVENQHVVWSVPTPSLSRNQVMLPYNYRLREWESDRWDPMDVASLAVVRDGNDIPWVYLGGYAGQVFKWWASPNDGMRDANNAGTVLTKAGTITTTAGQTSLSTFSPDGTVVLDADGQGLIERYCTISAMSNGVTLGKQRISANTSTGITLANTLSGLSPSTTYAWSVGIPDWQFDTRWSDTGGAKYIKKRYTMAYFELDGSTGVKFWIDFMRDLDPSKIVSRLVSPATTSAQGAGALWDSALWDIGFFELSVSGKIKFRIGLTGRYWQIRIRNNTPDVACSLTSLGVESEKLTLRS